MAPTVMERYRELTIAGVIALITRSLLMMGLETHRAAGHVRRYTLLEGGQQLLTFALSIAFIAVRGPAAEAPIWGLAIANLVCVLIDAPNMIRMTGRFNPRRAQLRALAQYGMPLTLSLFLGVVIASSDRIFIAWLMDESAVGIYSAAYSLADRPLSMLFNWVAMAATPIAFSAMEHEGAPGAQRVLEKTAKTLILVVLPAAAGLAVVAEPMAAVLIGKQFRAGAVSLVPPLALAGLLHGAMVHYAEHAYLITRRTKTLLVVTLIAALVNILLNVILIPIMGLYGAVVATIIAYAVGFACSMLVGRSVLAVPMPLVTLTKGVLACALMASAILMIHLPNGISGLLLGICLGAAVYALAAWVLDLADVRVRATQWATRRAVRRNGVG
jgi:O-antigen/teichoic acid export membrane protein